MGWDLQGVPSTRVVCVERAPKAADVPGERPRAPWFIETNQQSPLRQGGQRCWWGVSGGTRVAPPLSPLSLPLPEAQSGVRAANPAHELVDRAIQPLRDLGVDGQA